MEVLVIGYIGIGSGYNCVILFTNLPSCTIDFDCFRIFTSPLKCIEVFDCAKIDKLLWAYKIAFEAGICQVLVPELTVRSIRC